MATLRDYCGTAWLALRRGDVEAAIADLNDAPTRDATTSQITAVWGWVDALRDGQSPSDIADAMQVYWCFH